MRAGLLVMCAACGASSPARPAPAAVTPTPAPRTDTGWNVACPDGATFHLHVWGDAVVLSCARTDGTRDGRFTLFWSDGAVAVDGRYANGARAGTWTVSNPTFGHEREPLTTIEHRDAAPIDAEAAAYVWWFDDAACPDGGVLSRSTFDDRTFVTCKVDGVAHGPAAEFYGHGGRQAVGAYFDDEQHGHWIVWREADGTRFGDAHFDRGVDVGSWHYWDERGALIRTEVYDDGELVETITP